MTFAPDICGREGLTQKEALQQLMAFQWMLVTLDPRNKDRALLSDFEEPRLKFPLGSSLQRQDIGQRTNLLREQWQQLIPYADDTTGVFKAFISTVTIEHPKRE